MKIIPTCSLRLLSPARMPTESHPNHLFIAPNDRCGKTIEELKQSNPQHVLGSSSDRVTSTICLFYVKHWGNRNLPISCVHVADARRVYRPNQHVARRRNSIPSLHIDSVLLYPALRTSYVTRRISTGKRNAS